MRFSLLVFAGCAIASLWQDQVGQDQVPLGTDKPIESQSLLDFHRKLVTIPSVSGTELAVAKYLGAYLKSLNLTVEYQEVAKNRYNVYAYLGNKRNTTVLLTSHIDTVPPYLPYKVEGSRIYGRGSTDAKASVAAQVFAFAQMAAKKTIGEGDVALLYVVGEEVDGRGMEAVSASLGAHWEAAIFGEPTELKLGVGHKGGYVVNVVVNGTAAHSGYPELGVSATEALVPLLAKMLDAEWPASDLLGPSTLNIGKIDAGVAANVIPAHAEAQVFVRVAADLAGVDKTMTSILAGHQHVTYEVLAKVEPQYLDFEVPGFDSIVLAYATDIPHLHLQLQKRYLYGPGTIHVAHGANEYVEIQDLYDGVDGYTRLIKHCLG
ncbi:hypothetical protein JA9_002302 [Meyerozyma sp. JA9]|nr:hypothetical protein JA9_002302 [Meyerozyma sp. JA9]